MFGVSNLWPESEGYWIDVTTLGDFPRPTFIEYDSNRMCSLSPLPDRVVTPPVGWQFSHEHPRYDDLRETIFRKSN